MSITLDYEQIIGLETDNAREISSNFDNTNLASNEDYIKNLANYFIDFHTQLIRKPNFSGIIEFSGSKANDRALRIAKEKTGRSKILLTNLSHSSIEDTAKGRNGFFAGIGLEPIIIDADPSNNFQVDDNDLLNKIRQNDKDIAVVISTHGTTQLGHIENLATKNLVRELRNCGTWLHIDAAYGGVISRLNNFIPRNPLFCGTTDRLSRKIELPDADSYTLDPYKFIGKLGTSLLLIDKNNIPNTEIPYYDRSRFTLDTTISISPIVSWIQMIKDYGYSGLQELANDCVLEARLSAIELKKSGIKLVHRPELTIVPVALKSAEEVKYVRNKLKERGFKIGKLKIKGRNYQIDGVRFAVTPRALSSYNTRTLTKNLIKVIKDK